MFVLSSSSAASTTTSKRKIDDWLDGTRSDAPTSVYSYSRTYPPTMFLHPEASRALILANIHLALTHHLTNATTNMRNPIDLNSMVRHCDWFSSFPCCCVTFAVFLRLYIFALCKQAANHQVTTMLITSKKSYFQVITTGADDLTL